MNIPYGAKVSEYDLVTAIVVLVVLVAEERSVQLTVMVALVGSPATAVTVPEPPGNMRALASFHCFKSAAAICAVVQLAVIHAVDEVPALPK